MTRKSIIGAYLTLLGLVLAGRTSAQDVGNYFASPVRPVSVTSTLGEYAGEDGCDSCNSVCDRCCDDYCWSGFYIGGHGGWASADVRYSRGSLSPPSTPDQDFDANGFIGGGLIGYNCHVGNIVYGLEADISSGEFEGSGPDPASPTVLDYDIKQTASLRGRLGRACHRWLLFGTAGVGYAQTETSEPSGVSEEDHVGFVTGAGLEWAASDCLRLRGEYLFGTYSDEQYDLQSPAHSHTGGPDTHVVRWAVIWGF